MAALDAALDARRPTADQRPQRPAPELPRRDDLPTNVAQRAEPPAPPQAKAGKDQKTRDERKGRKGKGERDFFS